MTKIPKPLPKVLGPEARYRSNNGKGPMVARIVGVTEKTVKMEWWYEKRSHSRRKKFELPITFLDSPSCGWMLIQE